MFVDTSKEKAFLVETAKHSRAICKKCRQKCVQGNLRLARLAPNPVGSATMKTWYHIDCIFEVFLRQRKTTRRIERVHDIDGWDSLSNDDKVAILKKVEDFNKKFKAKLQGSSKKKETVGSKERVEFSDSSILEESTCGTPERMSDSEEDRGPEFHHNSFRYFRTIIYDVSSSRSTDTKINLLRRFFVLGTDGTGFKSDMVLWCRFLIPTAMNRNVPFTPERLVEIFCELFGLNVNDPSVRHRLEKREHVSRKIPKLFDMSKRCRPATNYSLTMQEVDEFLEVLTITNDEREQIQHLSNFITKCTTRDLRFIIRLILQDLRMEFTAEHVCRALHPEAYAMYQSCGDIKAVVERYWREPSESERRELPPLVRRRHSVTSRSESRRGRRRDEERLHRVEVLSSASLVQDEPSSNLMQFEPNTSSSQVENSTSSTEAEANTSLVQVEISTSSIQADNTISSIEAEVSTGPIPAETSVSTPHAENDAMPPMRNIPVCLNQVESAENSPQIATDMNRLSMQQSQAKSTSKSAKDKGHRGKNQTEADSSLSHTEPSTGSSKAKARRSSDQSKVSASSSQVNVAASSSHAATGKGSSKAKARKSSDQDTAGACSFQAETGPCSSTAEVDSSSTHLQVGKDFSKVKSRRSSNQNIADTSSSQVDVGPSSSQGETDTCSSKTKVRKSSNQDRAGTSPSQAKGLSSSKTKVYKSSDHPKVSTSSSQAKGDRSLIKVKARKRSSQVETSTSLPYVDEHPCKAAETIAISSQMGADISSSQAKPSTSSAKDKTHKSTDQAKAVRNLCQAKTGPSSSKIKSRKSSDRLKVDKSSSQIEAGPSSSTVDSRKSHQLRTSTSSFQTEASPSSSRDKVHEPSDQTKTETSISSEETGVSQAVTRDSQAITSDSQAVTDGFPAVTSYSQVVASDSQAVTSDSEAVTSVSQVGTSSSEDEPPITPFDLVYDDETNTIIHAPRCFTEAREFYPLTDIQVISLCHADKYFRGVWVLVINDFLNDSCYRESIACLSCLGGRLTWNPQEATHIIYPLNIQNKITHDDRSVIHVSILWVKNTIERETLQSVDDYVIPENSNSDE